MKKKKVLFGDIAEERLSRGVKTMSDAVGSTLGPQGRTVIAESDLHIGGNTVTKDGVTVAKLIHLEDPTENLGASLLREAASKTATQAGDGTTTSIVLASAILDAAKTILTSDSNRIEVIKHIKSLSDTVIENLTESSTPVTNEDLFRIAKISSNNDDELGRIIADAYIEAGTEGIVLADNSKNHETYFKVTNGMQFQRGLLSPYHMTDFRRQVCEMDEPLIILSSVELTSLKEIEQLLVQVVHSKRPLFIIGPMSMDATQTLNDNVQKGHIKACHITAPQFGDKMHELMEDMAVMFGGKYISEKRGDNWETITLPDLGTTQKVVVDRENTYVTRYENGKTDKAVKERVESLKIRLSEEKNDIEADFLRERIASLCGKVSTVYVGASSDAEQKEKKDRADDATLATKAAIEDGYLPGGGISLVREASRLDEVAYAINVQSSILEAKDILSLALRQPALKIMSNCGIEEHEAMENLRQAADRGDGFGFDAKTETIVNMIEAGIIDPAKVTKKAVQNAVSVSTTIMNTSTIIVDA